MQSKISYRAQKRKKSGLENLRFFLFYFMSQAYAL